MLRQDPNLLAGRSHLWPTLLCALAGLLISPTARAEQPSKPAGSCRGYNHCESGTCGLANSVLFHKLNRRGKPLRGFVDLHAHPMSHLGFGGKVLHGAPGIGVLMPSGTLDCSGQPKRAQTVAEALGSCYRTHGGHDFLHNRCGDHIRRVVLDQFENENRANKPHDLRHPDGYPTFNRWPKSDDLLHQTMWIDWVKRAHQGGLRVMVALTVNSVTLAKGVNGNQPHDDKSSSDTQLAELKRWVRSSSFMEIATSPEQLRRIVGRDKLAIVLGVELDDLGSFVRKRGSRGGRAPTAAQVKAEIRRLHRQGVRYILPIHVIDNYFGGAAVYQDGFARANRYHWGRWWDLECASSADSIRHKVQSGWDLFVTAKLGTAGGTQPVPACKHGHKNRRGLTALGRAAIDEMMRLGIIIDIDHMSQRTVRQVFAHTAARRYPLVSGHSGLRKGDDAAENARTLAEYREIARRGGIAGFGFANTRATRWLRDTRATLRATGNRLSFALGTDANGFAALPPARRCTGGDCLRYSRRFPKACFEGRVWNYNREGVAHYGLLPDFLRDVESHGGRRFVDKLFDGAEGFARTWEASSRARLPRVRRPPSRRRQR